MTYSIVTWILFGFWILACIFYWRSLYRISRKYPTGLFSLKDVISPEDDEVLKRKRAKLILAFIIWVGLLLFLFVLKVTGNFS